MDLQKAVSETLAGLNASLEFLAEFGRELMQLTLRPRVFVESYSAAKKRGRETSATAFLLMTLLLVELCVGLFERLSDAYTSMSEVGLGVVLQADSIWELSYDALIRRTLPLTVAVLLIAWFFARILGSNLGVRRRLQEVFPYALWRSAVLVVVFSIAIAAFLAAFVWLNFVFPPWSGVLLIVLAFFPIATVTLIGCVAGALTVWRLSPFVARLAEAGDHPILPPWSRRIFSSIIVTSLALPAWWSAVELSAGASKVALVLDDWHQDGTKFSANVRLRNLSGHRLFARKSGSTIQWWDDSHPVERRDILSSTPVANGVFWVNLAADAELKDSFDLQTFSGDLKSAHLTPRSYGAYDFMGGPEMPITPQLEYDATANSFQEILHDMTPGRIELRFVVATAGNKVSYRTEIIHRSTAVK